jgi:2-(1,2-epoxy-1,2-dihydrophenyl)acetyl-CoA isomerase
MANVLIESLSDGVATLTMNRPESLNALSEEMLGGFLEALPRLASDSNVGSVIVTGAGKAFCAGGDVKAMAAGTEFKDETLEAKAQALSSSMDVSRWLHQMPKPTIAMIPGAAAGAGLSIALSSDIRIASESAKFTTAFGRVGYSGDFGGSYFLTRLVGTAKARELYFTSAVLKAHEAAELGVVNRVVSDDNLLEETMKLATQMANGPRIALGYMKKNLNAAETGKLSDVFELEAWHHTRCGMTEDHKEAAQAFVDKRQPTFKGR